MTLRQSLLALVLATSLAAAAPRAAVALGDTMGAPCSLTSGGSASYNSVTCNFGLTPEQLRQVTKAAVEGATGPLIDRISDISKTLGVTQKAAESLLMIVGENEHVSDDRLADALTRVAADYKRLQAQAAAAAGLGQDNPAAQALVSQANAEINAGDFARAHESLRQATQAQLSAALQARKISEQARASEDAQMLGAARTTAAEGGVALTERGYMRAAELFGKAASYLPAGHPDTKADYFRNQGLALFHVAEWIASSVTPPIEVMKSVVVAYRSALEELTPRRSTDPLKWAQTQNDLADALETLGKRETGTGHLEEAVTAYRASLKEYTRDRMPYEWAETQNDLGFALKRLSERESGTTHLEEAVTAWEQCLTVSVPSTLRSACSKDLRSKIEQARIEIRRRAAK